MSIYERLIIAGALAVFMEGLKVPKLWGVAVMVVLILLTSYHSAKKSLAHEVLRT
jgi:uncharacterized membrane protein YkvI